MLPILAYSPPPSQNSVEFLRTNTCRYARHAKICAMNPLTGICPTRRTFLGYRYASPYGESLPFEIKWNPSAYPTPTVHCSLITAHWTFTFSAKERDPETGLSYFGSRYYSSDLSIWLSVDPMSDKYPSLSPYVYCANNPVMLVDPNGDAVIVTGADADSYVQGLNTKNLTFSRDESGYVSYQGIAKTLLETEMGQNMFSLKTDG